MIRLQSRRTKFKYDLRTNLQLHPHTMKQESAVASEHNDTQIYIDSFVNDATGEEGLYKSTLR